MGKLLGSFSKLETSPVQQIESIIVDRSRLLKRTQKVRTSQNNDEYDVENFDDTDFYQELLKQVITSKTYNPNTTDPTEITRNWLKLQEGKRKKRSRQMSERCRAIVMKLETRYSALYFNSLRRHTSDA